MWLTGSKRLWYDHEQWQIIPHLFSYSPGCPSQSGLFFTHSSILDAFHRKKGNVSHSLLLGTLIDLSRSKSELVAENALLRKPLIIVRRQVKRPACTKTDRMLLVLLARAVRTWKQALVIVQPEMLLRWHRQGFKLLWKYKSRAASLKPNIPGDRTRWYLGAADKGGSS